MNSKPNYFIPVGSSLVRISFAGHLSWHKHSTNISYTFVIFIPGYPVNNINIEMFMAAQIIQSLIKNSVTFTQKSSSTMHLVAAEHGLHSLLDAVQRLFRDFLSQ
jgi:hypothetical protein